MGKVNYFRTEVEFVGKPKTTKFADSIIRSVSQLFWEGRKVELFKTGSKDDYREILNHPSGGKKARAAVIFLISIPLLPLAFLLKAIDDDSMQNFKKYTVLKRTREQQVQNSLKAKKATHLENLEQMKRNLGDEELSKKTQNLLKQALEVMTPDKKPKPDYRKANHRSADPCSPTQKPPEGKYKTYHGNRNKKSVKDLFGENPNVDEPAKENPPGKIRDEKPLKGNESKGEGPEDLFKGLNEGIQLDTSDDPKNSDTTPKQPKQTGLFERLIGSKPNTPNAEKKGEDLEKRSPLPPPLKLIDPESGKKIKAGNKPLKETDPLPLPNTSPSSIGAGLFSKLQSLFPVKPQKETPSPRPPQDEVVIQINDTPPQVLSNSGKTRTRRRYSGVEVNPAIDDPLASPTNNTSATKKFLNFISGGPKSNEESKSLLGDHDLSD